MSRTRAPLVTAFFWGLAEGLFFFLVPDILLSYWALRGWRAALSSTLATIAGALVAACALYLLLRAHEVLALSLRHLWESLPGFRGRMTEIAAEHLRASGAAGLTSGPSSGIPYRVYVLEAWRAGIPLGNLLLWTPIARLERIVFAPLAVLALHRGGRFLFVHKLAWCNEHRLKSSLALLITAYWICLYIWYWGRFLPQQFGAS